MRSTDRQGWQSQQQPMWTALIAADLELMWKVQDCVRAWPEWIQINLARVVSHHPLRDVSIITWFAFLLGCHRFGFHFFWACCINLVGAAFLRLLLAAPRPFMYDQRLRPLTDRYEASHGLPSLETHMATVVAGWWAESGCGVAGIDDVRPLVRWLALGYICFVGFTRVYACSRFVHQVTISFLSGMVGLALGWRLSTHLDGLGLMMRHHLRGTAVVVIIALGILAYQVENNDSQLMGITKQEYLRVLSDIVKESQRAQVTTASLSPIGDRGRFSVASMDKESTQSASVEATEDGDGAEDGEWVIQDGAPWDGRMASPMNRRRQLHEERRDSFHFLQKTVERRAAEKNYIRPDHNRRDGVPNPGPGTWGTTPGRTSYDSGQHWRGRMGDGRGFRSARKGRFFAEAERAWGASLG